jgi:HAD superfamily hydrolase (TIGR01484 family)
MADEHACLLLASDLDGTLIPDGRAPESPQARPLLRRLAAHPGVCLAYATGRDPGLVDLAIAGAGLPIPSFLIADVGASLYRREPRGWTPVVEYWERLAPDWPGAEGAAVVELLAGIPGLRPQEPARQARFKASFYLDPGTKPEQVLGAVRERLVAHWLKTNLILSQDVDGFTGLLDCLPRSADKCQGIRFLRRWLEVAPAHTVFAGDSGNDLSVLRSEIPSVLVVNASESVRAQAIAEARANGQLGRLYLARGGYRGLNGNYAGGVLEGVVHYLPEADRWLDPDPVPTRRYFET